MSMTQTVAEEIPLFPSLAAMSSEHGDLLRVSHENGGNDSFRQEILVFIFRGQATGALLNLDDDRAAAQIMLDHWVTFLYRVTGEEVADTMLAEFDPTVAGKELPDDAFPFEGDLLAEKRGRSHSRRKIVDLCVAKIEKYQFLAVVGPAGSGRSSLVTDLVLPAVKDRMFGSAHWRYLPTSIDAEPLTVLARLIQPPDTDPEVWVRDQVHHFQTDPTHLLRLVNAAADEPAVLVIDHFERVFAVPNEQQVNAFLNNLIALIDDPKTVHSVIFVMRSEYLTHVEQFESLQPIFRNGQVFVGFDIAELRQAILDRARLVGLNFEEGLVDQLLLDVQGDPSPLTLLQFSLRRLWPERKANWITWDAYNRLGGGRVALERVANRLYGELADDCKETLKAVLLCLAQPGATQEVIVRPVHRDQLYKTEIPRAEIDCVLRELLRLGLVNENAGATSSESVIALAHEALASHWTPLVEWLSELRDARRRRLRLTAAAEQWRDANQDVAGLWGGSLLQEALAYDDRIQLEDAFVQASILAERKAETQKKQRIGLGFFALFIITTLSIWSAVAHKSKATAARQAKVKLTIANGVRPLENGDTAGGLIWFVDALKSDMVKSSPSDVGKVHQTRIAAGLRQLPVLDQLWRLTPEDTDEANSSGNNRPDWTVLTANTNRDGRLLLTASGNTDATNGAAHLLNTETGERSRPFLHDDGRVNSAALSHDGNSVATASMSREGDKGRVQIWNAKTGEQIGKPFTQDKGGVNHVAFSPDDRYLVMAVGKPGSDTGEAQVWDTKQKTLLRLPHQGPVSYAAFSADSLYLVTASGKAGGNTGWAQIWDLGHLGSEPAPILKMNHQGQVNRAEFSSDGRSIITASGAQGAEFGEAQLWELRQGDQSSDWKMAQQVKIFEHRAGTTCAAFSPDNRLVVTAGHDGWVLLWHVKLRRWMHTFKHGSSVVDASFSPDGRYVVTASRDQTAQVWDVATGDLAMPPMSHTGTVGVARFSPDGRRIFTVCKDIVRLWEFATGNPPAKFLKPEGEIKRVWTSEDGRHVITISERRGSEPSVAQLWDLFDIDASPQNFPNEPHLAHEPRCAALSPNKQFVVLADSGGAVRIWDRKSNTTTTIADKQDSVNYVAFSPDNRLVVVASGNISGSAGQAEVWNIETKESLGKKFVHKGGVTSASFSSDSRRIVTASADNSAAVWDVEKGTEIRRLSGHPADVMHASFSPDRVARYVVTASLDQTAVIWDTNSGKKIATLHHNGYVTHARFSSDGRFVVTASHEGRARLWYLRSGNSANHASEAAPLVPELVAILNHGGVLQQASFLNRSDPRETNDDIDAADRIITVGYYLPRLVGNPGDRLSARRRLVQIREWNIESRFQTAEEPQSLTRLLSARQINPELGEIEPVGSKELAATWSKVRSSYRNEFIPSDPRLSLDRQATACEDTEQWFAAAWYLNKAVANITASNQDAAGKRAALHARLARVNAEMGKMKEAAQQASAAHQ